MNENFKWAAAAVAVVGLSIGGFLYLSKFDRASPPENPAAAAPAQPPPAEEPPVKHPLAESDSQEAIPSLDDSDGSIQNALADLIGAKSVERFVISKDLVRHIVVTIDNLPDQKVAERIRPAKPTEGKFAVGGSEDAPVLDPANYERYRPVVQLLGSIDTRKLVAIYTRYYPLFQDAYENLGHPPKYFNDRLIEVIDHLLMTPDLQGPVELAQPNVLYEFADPALEARSAGQKVLLRMGSDNATVVKAELRKLRSELIAQQPEH